MRVALAAVDGMVCRRARHSVAQMETLVVVLEVCSVVVVASAVAVACEVEDHDDREPSGLVAGIRSAPVQRR